MSPPEPPVQALWKASFTTLYEALYQESCAEAVVSRWQRIDMVVAFLVAATASGSAVAGWAFWSQPGWRSLWAMIAGVAALAAIVDNVMTVPGRIKEQEELRRVFSGLRVSLETFRQDLVIGLDVSQARERYTKLRERYEEVVSRARRDISLTDRLLYRVQDKVNNHLRGEAVL